MGSLFGTLTGLAYTIPFACFGLIVANWTEVYKRKNALMAVCLAAAACMGGTAIFDSFLIFSMCRVLHGLVNSSSNPFSYSLTNDTIPAANRATANSLIHSGIYFGNALACLSILLIQQFGWRMAYGAFGGMCVAVAAAFALFVKEPERGVFMTEE